VRGYKLVQGKRGNRAWGDPAVAEEALKKMRIKHDQMYNYSLASPTNIEWVFKQGDLGPRQWAKVQELITQAEGRPSVAPETDKRPALVTSAAVSDFDDVTTPTPQGEEA
jgi:Spy/CpxP family protein refolding chaperone